MFHKANLPKLLLNCPVYTKDIVMAKVTLIFGPNTDIIVCEYAVSQIR